MIRKVGEDWDLDVLEEVSDDLISYHEEYYIIKLTSEGHPLLNIKRGDMFSTNCKKAVGCLRKNGVNNARDYSKIRDEYRKEKICKRERRVIEKALVHIGLDEKEENRIYKIGERTIVAERWVPKKKIIESLLTSNVKEFEEIFSKLTKQIEKI